MRTLRIYSPNNFHGLLAEVLIMLIMLYIVSLVLFLLLTGNLYFLTIFIRLPLPLCLTSGNHKSDPSS